MLTIIMIIGILVGAGVGAFLGKNGIVGFAIGMVWAAIVVFASIHIKGGWKMNRIRLEVEIDGKIYVIHIYRHHKDGYPITEISRPLPPKVQDLLNDLMEGHALSSI